MLYEGVIVPTALYGAEACGMRSVERRKVNVLEMKCLRSLAGVSRMDRFRNEEVRRRAGIEMELASRADQRVLRWFGTAAIFAWPCVLSDRLPMLWWLSHGEGRDTVT